MELRTGFVALLDVLGFTSLIAGDVGPRKLEQYLECLTLPSVLDGHTKVDYVVFSDSIVLTAEHKDVPILEAFHAIGLRCSRILWQMLDKEIAIRGAISYGSYYRHSQGNSVFIAGRPIVDAYAFEKAQDWVGIMIAPSALRQVPKLKNLCYVPVVANADESRKALKQAVWGGIIQEHQTIPFQSIKPLEPATFDGFAIVPTDGDLEPEVLVHDLSRSLNRIEWMKSVAPDPRSQLKYKGLEKWLRIIRDNWKLHDAQLRSNRT